MDKELWSCEKEENKSGGEVGAEKFAETPDGEIADDEDEKPIAEFDTADGADGDRDANESHEDNDDAGKIGYSRYG